MKRWLNPEREARIVELYEKYETTREVAAELGVCDETVRRALKKHGVKRTHRHDVPKKSDRVSHCRSKYCPALIVMLNQCMGYKAKAIAGVTGYNMHGVQNVLSKRGLVNVEPRSKKSDFDLDKIEYEYLVLGMSTYELGDKYGVNRGTISKWMRQRGICLGKGNHQKPENHYQPVNSSVNMDGLNESNARRHEESEKAFVDNLAEKTDGKFEYVSGYYRGKALIRCRVCGHEYVRSTDLRKGIECPECRKRQAEIRKFERAEARRYERAVADILEYALDKTCKACGKTFHSSISNQVYCCKQCKERQKSQSGFRHYYHVKYGDEYRKHYDPSISLKKLYERDGGICQICGEPCDWNDREWGSNGPTYPSIDHIIPRAKGGMHTWDNVQLAHCICNSRKRDLIGDELQEVMPIGA